jgi:hypothetical protein
MNNTDIIRIIKKYLSNKLNTILNLDRFKFLLENDIVDFNKEMYKGKLLIQQFIEFLYDSEFFYDDKNTSIDEIISLLIDKNINFDIKIWTPNNTLLEEFYHICNDRLELTKRLINNKYDLTTCKKKLLMSLITSNSSNYHELLFSHGYDINILYNGKFLIQYIIKNNNLELFKSFLKFYTEITIPDIAIIDIIDNDQLDFLEILLNYYPNINIKSKYTIKNLSTIMNNNINNIKNKLRLEHIKNKLVKIDIVNIELLINNGDSIIKEIFEINRDQYFGEFIEEIKKKIKISEKYSMVVYDYYGKEKKILNKYDEFTKISCLSIKNSFDIIPAIIELFNL